MHELFIQELLSSILLVNVRSFDTKVLGDEPNRKLARMQCLQTDTAMRELSADNQETGNPYDAFESGSIAIIPIRGLLTKYGSWWNIGMDEIASYVEMAAASAKISGIILLFDTPGGSVTALFKIENVLRAIKKPVYGFVDGSCSSAGIYIASFCSKIYAAHNMCMVGSIGAMGSIFSEKGAMEKYGYKIIEIYPKESKYKNLEVRQAIDGDTEPYAENILSPLALHFQSIIKTNRKKIDLSVEGIIEGKEFYAADAVKYKLIDGIAPLGDVITDLKQTLLQTEITSIIQNSR